MYLCGARYYSPDEARFVNRDPIGYAGGVNLYSYVGNNPMNGVDPSGLFGGGFPDPNDDSPSQDKYYTSMLTGRGTGIPAANKFFRFVSSFIPGVGQLLGYHEAVTGCDVTGTPVSNLDRVLGGLPAAGAAAGVLGGAGKALKGVGRGRDVILGTTEGIGGRNFLSELFNKILSEVKGGGNIPVSGTKSIVTHDAQAFGRELKQFENIHWDGKGLTEHNRYTLDEWDYIMQHPELHDKVIIHF